jgi:hypothetical protein
VPASERKPELVKTKTVIPAQPGFDLVNLVAPGLDELSYTSIIAWVITTSIEEYPCASPVCIGWHMNKPDCKDAIRQPNGDIVCVDGPTFRKGEEARALAYLVKQWEEQA